MMRFIFTIILVYLFACGEGFSQVNIIRGKVMDAENREPILGATIAVLNKQNRAMNGTITDLNGEFILKITDTNDSLRFSFIGYQSQTLSINDRVAFSVLLKVAQTELEEVVVIGKTRDVLTGLADEDIATATTKITFSDLDMSGSVSAGDLLQGTVSGLDVIAASGDPGSGSQLVIRGLSTLSNAFPLIVVDGIPRNVSQGDFDFSTATQEDLGNLINVSPQDISSIKVLKDAASTAVWGSQGANGVLLIDTNKGSKGKINYNYNYQVSLNVQPDAIPMLNGNEYITMQLEELHNSRGNFSLPDELAYNPHFTNFHNYNKNTDWIKSITRNGLNSEHYFGMSGGGQNTLFFTSVRYQKNIGTTLNTSFDQISTRVNLNYTFSNKLNFTINLDYNNSLKTDNRTPSMNVRNMAYIKAPNVSIWEYDEEGNPTGEYFTPIIDYQGKGDYYFNPVAIVNLSQNNLAANQLANNFKLRYRILSWLSLDQTISFQYTNNKIDQFLPSSAVGADWLDDSNNISDNRLNQNNNLLTRTQLFMNFLRNQTKHTLSSAFLLEVQQYTSDWKQMQTNRTSSVQIKDPAGASPISYTGSGSSESRSVGTLANINYKYKDLYLLTTNIRADANSSLGVNERWTFFPSIQVAWKISNEPWLSNFTAADLIKIRADWGRSGHMPGGYYTRFGLYNTNGQYINRAAIQQMQINLLNYTMEITSSWDIGLDMDFFNYRLNVTGDIYNSITSNLAWPNYEIPFSSGFNNLKSYNGGKLQNIGWELATDWKFIQRQDYNFNFRFNIAHNENMFLEFPDNFNTVRSTSIGNGEYPREVAVGNPIGSFYGFRYLGVWASDEDVVATDKDGNILMDLNGNKIPLSYKETYIFKGGDAHYDDVNHDGNIDLNDVVYLGNSNPLFIGGFGLSSKYKNFRLNTFFNYRMRFDIVNEVAIQTEGMSNTNNQSKAVLHRWRYQGQSEPGLLPRAYLNHPANNLGSDRYVEGGDFIRLNNVSLQYTLNKNLCNRLNLKSANMTFTMRKILTFTRYSGQDPEISSFGADPFWMGTDNAKTPVPKIFTINLAITI